MTSDRLDLVVLGASGFTGKHVVKELQRIAIDYPEVTWAIAGRSREKLETLLSDVGKKIGKDLSQTKIIIADVNDKQSLMAMCSQTKILINCCGPFVKYGENVVSSAVICKTHYVDVSGEIQFIEHIEETYDQPAKAANVFIINACGLSSIPADLGVSFLEKNFNGTLNSVESYLSTHFPAKMILESCRSGIVQYNSWESIINSMADLSLKKLRQKSTIQMEPEVKQRWVVYKNFNKWNLPYPGADSFVVDRTQRHLFSTEGKRPVQYRPYITFGCIFYALGAIIGGLFLLCLCKISCTRRFLLNYPRLCTFGFVTYGHPKEGMMDGSSFQHEMIGRGWDKNTNVSNKMNKQVVARISVSGADPAYVGTANAVIFCALTILKEKDKMPFTGGVLTAGAAFKNTNIVKHLQENDIKFEIVESKFLP
ncbi:unnamed protein product, partial [Brenthis ino]